MTTRITRDRRKGVWLDILIRDQEGFDAADILITGTTGLGIGKVRPLREEDLDSESPSGRRIWSRITPENQKKLAALLELRTAIQDDDPLAIEACIGVLDGMVTDFGKGMARLAVNRLYELKGAALEEGKRRQFMQAALAFLNLKDVESKGRHVSKQSLGKVMVAFWWDKGRFRPALFTEDYAVALALHTLLEIPTVKRLRVCPACHKLFVSKHPNQGYCVIQHREYHRVRRYRARAKQRKGRLAPVTA